MGNPVKTGAAAEIIRSVGQWQVPALGAGTWALGGPWEFAGAPAGWGELDDAPCSGPNGTMDSPNC